MRKILLYCLAAGTTVATPSAWSATLTVNSGEDLQAIVDTAVDGDIVVIDSSEVFITSLNTGRKSLTIRAGSGYSPTIKGLTDQAAIYTYGSADSANPFTLTIEGLNLLAGDSDDDDFSRPSLDVIYTRDVDSYLNVNILDSFLGEALLVADRRFYDIDETGSWQSADQGATISTVVINGSTIGAVIGGDDGDSVSANISVSQSTITSVVSIATNAELYMDQSRIMGGLYAIDFASPEGPKGYVEISNSIIEKNGDSLLGDPLADTGLLVLGDVEVHAVNVTVTGFEVGVGVLKGGPNASTFENMLVFGNTLSDVANAQSIDNFDEVAGPEAGAFSNSVIGDDKYPGITGVNGNIAGEPLVDEAYNLLPGSPGIDIGNNTANGIGDVDLYGDTRIQDGDGDGVATVDAGALETFIDFTDDDEDGVPDFQDNCPVTANPDQLDSDEDGKGDACEDGDSDGVADPVDNCPLISNTEQLDTDSDGLGDACDDTDDSGNDNLKNVVEESSAELDRIIASTQGRTRRILDHAAQKLDKALRASYWEADNALSNQGGRQVFQSVSLALNSIERVADARQTEATLKAQLDQLSNALLDAMRTLADAKLAEATVANGSQRRIQRAVQSLAAGDRDRSRDWYKGAVANYGNAWSWANSAI